MKDIIAENKSAPEQIKNKTFIHPQDKQLADVTTDGFKLPGLIDIHFHGAFGWDFAFGNPQKINEMLDKVLARGITGLFPTLITCPEEQRIQALRDIAKVAADRKRLPVIHGINLEGPFLAAEKRGSHPEECLMAPTMAMLEKWQAECNGLIRIVTIAPELPGAIEFIREASKAGVIIALGHSNADWATTERAIEAGAKHVTHLFNAMPQLNHRQPNLLSCILTRRDDLSVEIIGDCEHVAPELVKFAFSIYENTNIIVVSDAVAPTGMPDGEYDLYNNKLTKCAYRCCLKSTGHLFGGGTMLTDCLPRLNSEAGISWGILGTSVWRNPCNLMKIEPPDTEVYFDTSMKWLASRHRQTWFSPAADE